MSEQQSPLTYDKVLKMFRRTERMMKRMSQESDQRFKESERKWERTEQAIGRLGNRIGDIIEHMVGGGNIVKQFQALGYAVTAYWRNMVFENEDTSGQIDVFLEYGDIAILIEVKTNLTTEYVHEHVERLEKYRRYIDAKGNGNKRRFIGAVAGAVADKNVIDFAQKKGFYVIVQSGVAVEIITPPEGFQAKEW